MSVSYPSVRFAVMSMSDNRDCISGSLAGGMHGFVSKRQPDEDILFAIKEFYQEAFTSPGLRRKAAEGQRTPINFSD